jgi:hypothetical protein
MDDAISLGIRRTAGVVTSAAMVGVFSIFGLLSLLFFKQFGVGLATAILIDATIIRAVLLPATMKLLGEWNWYLPLARVASSARGPHVRARTGDRAGSDLRLSPEDPASYSGVGGGITLLLRASAAPAAAADRVGLRSARRYVALDRRRRLDGEGRRDGFEAGVQHVER